PGRELQQRRLEPLGQLPAVKLGARIARGGTVPVLPLLALQRDLVSPPRPLPQARDRHARGHPVQPRRELRLAAEGLDGAQKPDIGLLGDIGCVVRIPRQAERQGVHVPLREANQLLERFGPALLASLDDLGWYVHTCPAYPL